MLEVCKPKKDKTTFNRDTSVTEKRDIIVYRRKEVVIHNEDGSYTIKEEKEAVNLTKKINESKKLIKNQTAKQKLREIEKIFTTEA